MAKRVPYTSMTMKWLRETQECSHVGVVERWQAQSMRRIDLFGIIDLVALRGTDLIGVQTTSMACGPDHHVKIVASDSAIPWCETGALLWLVCWRKLAVKNKDGSTAKVRRWKPHVREYDAQTLRDSTARVLIK